MNTEENPEKPTENVKVFKDTHLASYPKEDLYENLLDVEEIAEKLVEEELNVLIIDVDKKKIKKFRNKVDIILFTATQIEKSMVLKHLKPLKNKKGILRAWIEQEHHHIGCLGKYCVVLIQVHPGITEPGSIELAGYAAFNFWKPKIAILCGIAYGLDEINQNYGDVLISTQIINYEKVRVGITSIDRGAHPECDGILLNIFSAFEDSKIQISEREYAKLIFAPILSGEKLVDNLKFRDDLIKRFPKARGGEMEGIGLYILCKRLNIRWIIIKGICDFGHKKKDQYQKLATNSSISFIYEVFNDFHSLDPLEIKPICKR